ncbi:MAG: hypothetical protein FRX49_03064 [Trebouxia sp. A1-2]|nr:MAG: hypothetical protein FRX49_03064 [Trebouxia sp. A1-2]
MAISSARTEGDHVMEMGREGSPTWRSTFMILMLLFTLGSLLASRSQMLMNPPCTITALDIHSNHLHQLQQVPTKSAAISGDGGITSTSSYAMRLGMTADLAVACHNRAAENVCWQRTSSADPASFRKSSLGREI